MTACPLCAQVSRIRLASLSGHPDADGLVAEFPSGLAVLGPSQFYRGYCRLIYRWHAEQLCDSGTALVAAFAADAMILGDAIQQALGCARINLALLGQQIPHLHWHVVPRYADEPEPARSDPPWTRPEWETWHTIPSAEEQRAIIAAIRERLCGLPGVRVP